jgi:hypothetical protein
MTCWKWRPHVVRIMKFGASQKCVFRFFRVTRMCLKCLSSNTPTLPYSNALWNDCGLIIVNSYRYR